MGRPPKARGAGGASGGRKAAKGGRRWSWTPDRCNVFNEVVKALGGREKATPEFILKHLKARGGVWGKITREQMHSHLQYLRWVLRNPNQVQKTRRQSKHNGVSWHKNQNAWQAKFWDGEMKKLRLRAENERLHKVCAQIAARLRECPPAKQTKDTSKEEAWAAWLKKKFYDSTQDVALEIFCDHENPKTMKGMGFHNVDKKPLHRPLGGRPYGARWGVQAGLLRPRAARPLGERGRTPAVRPCGARFRGGPTLRERKRACLRERRGAPRSPQETSPRRLPTARGATCGRNASSSWAGGR